MTRQTVDKIWKVSRVALLGIGLIVAAMGLIALGTELWLALINQRAPRWPWLSVGTAMVLGGAALVQTLNVEAAFTLVTQVLPLVRSRIPGGRRSTDLPAEEDDSSSLSASSKPSPSEKEIRLERHNGSD